jgi:hypothetical protein
MGVEFIYFSTRRNFIFFQNAGNTPQPLQSDAHGFPLLKHSQGTQFYKFMFLTSYRRRQADLNNIFQLITYIRGLSTIHYNHGAKTASRNIKTVSRSMPVTSEGQYLQSNSLCQCTNHPRVPEGVGKVP